MNGRYHVSVLVTSFLSARLKLHLINESLDSLSAAGIEVIDAADIPWDFLALSAFLGLCFNLTLNFGVAYTYLRVSTILSNKNICQKNIQKKLVTATLYGDWAGPCPASQFCGGPDLPRVCLQHAANCRIGGLSICLFSRGNSSRIQENVRQGSTFFIF